MSLNLSKENRIYKKLFNLKPPQRDGLVLNLHHTNPTSQKVRFINGCFNNTGQVLAVADNEGNLFIIDFNINKFWNVPKVTTSCSVIKFSKFKSNEILVGSYHGPVVILDVETGLISGKLMGHEFPVRNISFAPNFMCLTASECEAVVWVMQTHTKVHVLRLDHCCTLKHVSFIPVTSNILALFNDDFIQIWQFGTFEIKTQIPPLVWFNHNVKSVTFTADGKVMVLGCHPNYLSLFLLSNFKLLKFITLPEHIQTIKHVEFISQINDGGSNKILAILAARGTIHFYDIEQNIIISELIASDKISRIENSGNGNFIACVLCSGNVNVYNFVEYIVVPVKTRAVRVPVINKKEKERLHRCLEKLGLVKEQMREMLEIEKLRTILRDCGEYPDAYRVKIWEHLLELPNNKAQYNSIINHRMIISFEDLCQKYPLENKRCLKNLKQLLDNLVTWCPFFLHVDYLPLFVFPFVKVFHNKPLACFEAVCTIIMNWCQFWFEYFPLPPINILSMVENVLMQHDPELLNFFQRNDILTQLYAWPFLRTAFSEVLTAPAWKKFWDHVLTNEPAFLLCAVVAYNTLQRTAILNLRERSDFECFYNTHHPVDIRKLLSRTYDILTHTNESIHPCQYLNMFKRIRAGEYPNFCGYPKTALDFKSQKEISLKEEIKHLKTDELDLFRKRLTSLNDLQNFGLEEEENRRVLEMESAIRKQILEEQERVQNYYERLALIRDKFRKENGLISELEDKITQQQRVKRRTETLSTILQDVKFDKRAKNYEFTKTEDKLLQHYSELLRNKCKIEQLLSGDEVLTSTRVGSGSSIFDRHQNELSKEIDFARKIDKSEEHLKMLNLATGLAAMNDLINKIETELEKEQKGVIDQSAANKRVRELAAETKDLTSEVNELLQLLASLRNLEEEG